MKEKHLFYGLKQKKNYFYYLFLVLVTMFLIFLFFYQNPNFLPMFLKSLNLVETEEQFSNPFASSTNTTTAYMNENVSSTSWVWPTVGNYYISQTYHSGHDGIDIAGCPYNSNIYAAGNGTVVTVARKWDNGLYIVICHDNGYYTMYAHLATVAVSEGQSVRSGQIIGGMGRSGNATGTHLHFSLWTAYPYYGRSLSPWTLY